MAKSKGQLIYQVCLGKQANSALYKKCIESVSAYCKKYDIVHYVQRTPRLKIKPHPVFSNRSKMVEKNGILPIYEKENAFDLLEQYDQIAIIDADIYIRDTAPNIFEEMTCNCAFGAVVERDMPINKEYKKKIFQYSAMQYARLGDLFNSDYNNLGYKFYNMGLIVLNCKKFKPYLKGRDARQFITQPDFTRFIDGEGAWKWSTDQTLLNYFLRRDKVPTKDLDWRWNGLFSANTQIEECYFVHFFLKDKLPKRGENVDELMRLI